MGGKASPLIIILLLIVLVGVGGLIFKTLTNDSSTSNKNNIDIETYEEIPVITLNKEVDPENDTKVIITVYASTETEGGVEQLILPDGNSVFADTATYDVEENGTYEFKAISYSGGESSETIEVTEIVESSATNPYIPEEFTVVNDNIDEGFVIEDKYGNQYVWIPVENGKLTRNTMLSTDYVETGSTASELVNSVAKYYGFYIGRFEASQYEVDGLVAAASMAGKIPWTNVSYLNAVNHAENADDVFGYKNCKTALLNSYAWDTTLAWIDSTVTNYSSNVNYGNYSGTIYPTGYTESDNVKNICDIAGNVREWTTEIYKSNKTNKSSKKNKNNTDKIIQRVVRGGSANLSKTPASHIYYPENTSDNYWGFRTILYK